MILWALPVAAQTADERIPPPAEAIQATINVFKTGDIDAFAGRVQFPLARSYPLPPVIDAKDFARRYSEIFDSDLSKLISRSDAKRDWEEVGWRGYMLHNGAVWADVTGLITAINHQSQKEKILRARLIEADRNALHPHLRTFDEPTLKWDTKHYRLRIDAMGEHYRLALWPAGQTFRDAPQLIIEHGTRTFEGSGGNHYYSFPIGEKIYVCNVTVLGGEETPHIGTFERQIDGKTDVREEALREY